MAISIGLGGIAVAMKNRNYRLYTYGAIPSLIGTWIQRMAVGWLAWELTQSGMWLGLVAFADLAPTVLTAPIAGAFADRVDRLRMVRFVQYMTMLQASLLAFFTLTENMTIEILVGLAFFQGAMQGVHQPFRQSLIGTIVSKQELTSAIGINSTIWNTSRLIGPALSALIILKLGVGYTFLFNAFSYCPMLATLYMIRVDRRPSVKKSIAAIPGEIAEGFKYVSRHNFIAPLMILLFVFSFFGRATAEMLPGFTDAVFRMGADGLAILTGAAGLGSLFSGLWLSRRGTLSGLPNILIILILLIAVSQIAFISSNIFWVAACVFAGWGFVLNGSGIIAQSLVQTIVPDSIRGRVVSLYGMLWLGTPAIGALVMGVGADFVGFRLPVAVGGVCILVAYFWARFHRQKLNSALEELDHKNPK